MSIVVNTNVPVLRARNMLSSASWNINKSMERLTTGKRINRASDDPAGYFCAMQLDSEIRGTKVAYQNAQIGMNILQTAESDLSAINSQLDRIKELAIQFANGTLSEKEQTTIKMEVQQRVDEINRIASKSEFNGVKLLDGSHDNMRLQIGSGSDSTVNAINIDGVFLDCGTGQDGIGLFGGADGFADIEAAFTDAETAAKFIDIVQSSANIVNGRISTAGAYTSRLESITDNIMVRNENLSAAYSTIMDVDIAEETANYVKNQILQQTSSSLLTQALQANGAIALNLINSL